MVGNSSSALVEAPYFQLAAINMGKRQLGRPREENVIDAEPTKEGIAEALTKVGLESFREVLSQCGKRLGNGTASQQVIDVLLNLDFNEELYRKRITY